MRSITPKTTASSSLLLRQRRRDVCFLLLILLYTTTFVSGIGIGRYYGAYISMASGDTLIYTLFNHGGYSTPNEKWNVECLDGEAMVGIQDSRETTFDVIDRVHCKFMFPEKPTTHGFYPFYEHCTVRNVTTEQFDCFDPKLDKNSYNTFVVGMREDDFLGRVSIVAADPNRGTAYKCCSMPHNYEINYGACFYIPTHDQFWEYYDSDIFVVECPEHHVMTGMGAIVNPWINRRLWDWIQCCPFAFVPQPKLHYVLPPALPYRTTTTTVKPTTKAANTTTTAKPATTTTAKSPSSLPMTDATSNQVLMQIASSPQAQQSANSGQPQMAAPMSGKKKRRRK